MRPTRDYFPLPVLDIDPVKKNYRPAKCAAHLAVYHKLIREDGTLRWGFYDGSADTEDQLFKLALSPERIFMLCYENKNPNYPVGHVMLTNFNGYCSMVHFNVLREYHFRAREICEKVINKLLTLKRVDDTPLVQTFVGLTPESNRAARKLNSRLGFVEMGRLKKACHMHYFKKFDDGILTKREIACPQIQANGQI